MSDVRQGELESPILLVTLGRLLRTANIRADCRDHSLRRYLKGLTRRRAGAVRPIHKPLFSETALSGHKPWWRDPLPFAKPIALCNFEACGTPSKVSEVEKQQTFTRQNLDPPTPYTLHPAPSLHYAALRGLNERHEFIDFGNVLDRSEERRVGKECRAQ